MDLDSQVGYGALKAFHNKSCLYPNYGLSWDQFSNHYGIKFPIMATGIGLAARVNEISDSTIQDVMEGLADEGKGRLPDDWMAFQKAIGTEAMKINWITIYKDAAIGVGKEIGTGAVELGKQVQTSLSWMTTLLPFIVIGGAIFWVYNFARNTSGGGATFSDLKKIVKRVKTKTKKGRA